MAGQQYIGAARQGTIQNVAYTGTAAASSAFGSETYKVRLVATTDAFALISGGGGVSTTVATTANAVFLPASVPEYFSCTPGQAVSVIQNASNGTLNIMECA